MKKIIKEVIKDALLVTLVLTCFTITAHTKPLYKESQEVALKSNNKTSLELGSVNLCACYGASGNNGEFYIDNALIENLDNYVIHKELDFTCDTGTKLTIEKINLSNDNCNKGLCMKAKVGDEWLEVRGLKNFQKKTFGSLGKCEIWIWYELNLLTKADILESNGADVEIVFGVE